ncbi:hypothetical protein JCM11251_004496 [Rhodosporidiobolus azoricus]
MQAHLFEAAVEPVESRLRAAWTVYEARPPSVDPVTLRSFQQLELVWTQLKPGLQHLAALGVRLDEIDEASASDELVHEFIFEQVRNISGGLRAQTLTGRQFVS